jgi:hypothetical protein
MTSLFVAGEAICICGIALMLETVGDESPLARPDEVLDVALAVGRTPTIP